MKMKNNHKDHGEGTKNSEKVNLFVFSAFFVPSPCPLWLKKLKLTAMSFRRRPGADNY